MKGLGLSIVVLFGLTVSACRAVTPPANLPEGISNNAVALYDDGYSVSMAYSFYGLKAGKTWTDISTDAFACWFTASKKSEVRQCEKIQSPPVSQGRLAAAAVSIYPYVYVIGGYTVAEDGHEESTPEIFEYNRNKDSYKRLPDMPTPVDDMVAFTYQGRYIYLVSGWHNDGNVNLVQVYDIEEKRWFRATDYPGAPVFGHAGGIAGGQILIADGVAVTGKTPEGRRKFGAVDEVWQGRIDPEDPAIISWTKLPPHPGKPLYRMASTGDDKGNRIIFAGGADNPYNYNGIGYDGVPAKPSSKVFAYDFDDAAWTSLKALERATMDHRGLLKHGRRFYTLGGMDAEQHIISDINLALKAKR